MTEAEWETSTDAAAMLVAAGRKCGARKFRLLACACARSLRYAIVEKEYRQAIDVAEQFADGLVNRDKLESAASSIEVLSSRNRPREGDHRANAAAEATVALFAGNAAARAVAVVNDASDIVREIVSDSLRMEAVPVGADNDAVRNLAEDIYTQRTFHKLSQLADLLCKNGCDDQRLLTHLRSHGPHYRGCWALDAVLGYSPSEGSVVAEWRHATIPFEMLQWWQFCRGNPSARKERLLACASCRLIDEQLTDENLRHTLVMTEAYADGLIPVETLTPLHQQAMALIYASGDALHNVLRSGGGLAAFDGLSIAQAVHEASCPDGVRFTRVLQHTAYLRGRIIDHEDAAQAALVRDLLGSPFGEPVIASTWWTADVLAIARGIYDERAFERLPILADALQDAGCEDEAILEHCRSEGPHVRGCWVVDLLLGKS